MQNPKPPEDQGSEPPPAAPVPRTFPGRNGSDPVPPDAAAARPRGPSGIGRQGDSDALLQEALNALIYGDAAAAAEAARVALARADGPDRESRKGWAAWLVGLAHLYTSDPAGAAPYLQRAHDLALETQQPTMAMAAYLGQQLAGAYQEQAQWRLQAARLLKQIAERDVQLTQQFQAMLKLVQDAWPQMHAIALPAPGLAPAGANSEEIEAATPPPPAALPLLQVQMLGLFRVAVGDREISLRQSRKAADILKYMLAHRARPTSKDTLLQTFWPDVEQRIGTHRLHLAISSLRQMLDAGTDDAPGYVIFRNDAYFLNPRAAIDIDVERFLEYAKLGQTLARAGRLAEAASPYEAAVELYHDDYLIENLYDDWTASGRTRLRETYLDLLAGLCAHYLQTGRHTDCLEAARKMLARDPYREDAHRYVMRGLLALGQRNQALLQYQICFDALAAGLGVAPDAATAELYQQIKSAALL